MSTITQPREVPVIGSYDVVVCGLGTSGTIAAITAARHGLSVLGIEAFNCPGGTTTIGGIIGKIVSIKEETCVIETAHDKTKIRILKTAISRVDVKAEDAED